MMNLQHKVVNVFPFQTVTHIRSFAATEEDVMLFERVAVEQSTDLVSTPSRQRVQCHVPRGHGVRVRARDRQPQGHPPERAQQTISATQHAPAATTLLSFNPGPVAFISFQWLEMELFLYSSDRSSVVSALHNTHAVGYLKTDFFIV